MTRPWKVELEEIVDGVNILVDGRVIGCLDFYPRERDGKDHFQLVVDSEEEAQDPVVKVLFTPGGIKVELHEDLRPERCEDSLGKYYHDRALLAIPKEK